jgi:hypothetical protein
MIGNITRPWTTSAASEFVHAYVDRLQLSDTHSWTITDAALSPDNKFLAYSSIASVVYLADTTPGRDDTLRLDFSRGSPPHSMQPRSGVSSHSALNMICC